MPAVAKPSNSPAIKPTGAAVPTPMKTAVVETRFTPLADLITRISGGRVVVGYYQQLLRANDAPRPLDTSLEPAQQQYRYIRNLEIRQQGDWSATPDDEDKEFEVTGEAITYPGFVPNVGDMMTVDVGQGRWGIAKLTQATPLTIQAQTCFRITFRVMNTMNQEWLSNLTLKTIESCYFVMDFLRAGKNPYIVDEVYDKYRSLDQEFSVMVADYFRNFFSDVNQTLVMPGQPGGAYDPFLTDAVLSILDVTQHPMLSRLTAHSLDVQYAYNTTTIWDALLNVEPSYLGLATHNVGLIDKSVVRDRGVFGGFYWTQIKKIMFPKDDRTDGDIQFSKIVNPDVQPLKEPGVPITDLERIIINNADSVNMPLVDEDKPVLPERLYPRVMDRVEEDDLSYVFSKAFYEKDHTKMSLIEKLSWSILEHNEIDIPKLHTLVDSSRRWDKLDRFYFVPVLMWMCVIALRGPSHA